MLVFKNIWRLRAHIIIGVLIVGMSALMALHSPPKSFPEGRLVNIPAGSSLRETANILESRGVIRSSNIFMIQIYLMSGDNYVMAGNYYFEQPGTATHVARRLSRGVFGLDPIKVRIEEGSTRAEMATKFGARYSQFDKDKFMDISEGYEGYLFPDTYYFLENVKAEQVFNELRSNFNKKVGVLAQDIADSNLKFSEIMTLASLIEKEAWKNKDRRLISGVLRNRLKINMPLQVDAVFPFIISKNTYEVTLDDLKVDSPYNTYLNRGLPPAPIANPSLNSIEAALHPEESNYLYYLSDRFGNTYYATDFETHIINKIKYVR